MSDVKKMTTQELLDNVTEAINAIMIGGQSYKIGSRTLTRANLTELNNLRSDLAAQAAAEKAGGRLLDDCYVAVFDGR